MALSSKSHRIDRWLCILSRLYLLRNQYEAVLKAFYEAHLLHLFIEGKQLAPAPVHRKAGKFPAHYVRKVRKRANVIEP